MCRLTPGVGIRKALQMSDRSGGSDNEDLLPSALDTLEGIIVPEAPNESISPEIQANAVALLGPLLEGEGAEASSMRTTLKAAVVRAVESGRPVALGAEALVR